MRGYMSATYFVTEPGNLCHLLMPILIQKTGNMRVVQMFSLVALNNYVICCHINEQLLYYANNKVHIHADLHKLCSIHLHLAMSYKVPCPSGDVAG